MKTFNDSKSQHLEELEALISSSLSEKELEDRLSDYHDNDIAEILEKLTPQERLRLYRILGVDRTAEIFAYLDDAGPYMEELSLEKAANVVSHMDSDDAVDVLEDMDESRKAEIVKRLDHETSEDVKLLWSYDDDEIGSCMTTNYICIHNDLTIRQAMRELIRQAGENDNISTIYVVDEQDKYYGAIDLKDLIVARDTDTLESIISRSYPYLLDNEKTDDCVDRIKEYAEDSLPVLTQEGKIAGIITSSDVVEMVDDAMGDDYAKLGGLTAEEDLEEKTTESVKKRLPWLIILLFLGMGVSTVVGMFESVVAVLPIVMCFQSLILDMAGNVGTQSLAVTIRVLMDESLTGKQKLELVWKEMRIGLCNGGLLGILSFALIGLYIYLFKGKTLLFSYAVSGCIGVALLLAMLISSAVGTCIPLFFKKINIDPAVASGPLITTVNDLVAVITYYGLSWLFLLKMLNLAG